MSQRLWVPCIRAVIDLIHDHQIMSRIDGAPSIEVQRQEGVFVGCTAGRGGVTDGWENMMRGIVAYHQSIYTEQTRYYIGKLVAHSRPVELDEAIILKNNLNGGSGVSDPTLFRPRRDTKKASHNLSTQDS